MRIGIMTPVRLLGEGVALSLRAFRDDVAVEVVVDLSILSAVASRPPGLDAAIIDVTQAADLDAIREFHAIHPLLPLLALGLREHESEIVEHGRAGFTGYIRRDDGPQELCRKLLDAVDGRFACSPEIAAGIMRGLFHSQPLGRPLLDFSLLTTREEHVARLIARGLSNKEIARELALSESTVKHHVHSLFGKMGLSRRSQVRHGTHSRDLTQHPRRLVG